MTIFTIDGNDNLTIHTKPEEAQAVPDSQHFSTMDQLAAIAANWPTARLIEIWNSIPGNTRVKKFTDRKSAVTRIWKAIQTFGEMYALADQASAPVAESFKVEKAEAAAAPATEPAQEPPALEVEAAEHVQKKRQTKMPADAPKANVGEQTPDVAPAEPSATKKATRKQKAPMGGKAPKSPREESKTSRVIEMLKREGGTTLKEIMSTMGWQKHTTRAMLSAGGSLTKKHGLVVTSEKGGDQRVYSIKA